MRSDETLGARRSEQLWSGGSPEVWARPGDPLRDTSWAAGSVSFSGLERNHLFLNLGGARFQDVSSLSGADSISDSRGVALFDYDRDGWQDLVLINTNRPLLELYRNRLGDSGHTGRSIALRLVGGNRSAEVSSTWSNRDGVGALVTMELGDLTLTRERRAGEGFAVQNSATLVIGIGARDSADVVRVRWPSGRVQETQDVAAGTLLTLYEDPSEAPSDVAFVRARYRSGQKPSPSATGFEAERPRLLAYEHAAPEPPLSLFITTATWCEACKKSLPQVSTLRARFRPEELALLGVPIDPDDTAAKLRDYVAERAPAYRLLVDVPSSAAEQVQALIRGEFGDEILPAAIATDHTGRVVALWDEVPSVSEVRRLLHAQKKAPPAKLTLRRGS